MRSILLLYLYFIPLLVVAQHEYVYTHYTQNNGLPQNSINDLFWDKNDFLWLSTEEGLVRFDGGSFCSFNVSNKPFLKTDRFRGILNDAENNIYASTADGGVYNIKNNQLVPSNISVSKFIYYRGVLPVQPTLAHLLAVSSKTNGAFNRQWRIFPIQLLQDGNNNYVLGLKHIFRYNNQGNNIDSFELARPVKFVLNIGKRAYALSNNQLFLIDFVAKKLVSINTSLPAQKNSMVQVFPQILNNEAFVAIDKKVYLLTATNNPLKLKIQFKLNVSNIVTTEINSIAHDCSKQLLAIGSITNGLYLFKPKLFYTLKNASAKELGNFGYYAHVPINDSTVLNCHGVELTLGRSTKSNYNLKGTSTGVLFRDKNNAIWGTNISYLFYQFKDKNRVAIPLPPNNKVNGITEQGDSIYIISSKNIFILHKYKIIYTIPLGIAANINDLEDWSSYIIEPNKIILGKDDGVYTVLLKAPHLVTKLYNYAHIRSLKKYNDWIIGTSYGEGLFIIYNNNLIKLPVDKQQYLKKCHTIEITDNGNIFISTNNGLFKTTITELKNYLNKSSTTIYYQYYDESEGIENTEFNGACSQASVALKNGYLSFANMGGLVWFNPNVLPQSWPLTQHFYINQIDEDGKPIPVTDTIYINANSEKINFEYSFVYWQNRHNIKLEYKLDGYTKEWSTMPAPGQGLWFTNLPSGTYTLLIKSQTGYDAADIELTQLTIIKAKKYYETSWFKLLVIVGATLIAISLVYLYNKRLIKQNAALEKRVKERTLTLESINKSLQQSEHELMQSVNVKNKLISIISHDIITPLRFISLVSKNFKDKDAPANKENEVIKEIHHTSQHLYDNAQNVLNWVRYQNKLITVNKTTVSPYAIVEDLCELFKDFASMQKNTLVNEVDMDDIIQSDKNILIILIQNILSNAVKYTHSSTIKITSANVNGKYKVIITDDGTGISPNNLLRIDAIRNKVKTNMFDDSADGTGLGYIIIFELAELIGADVQLSSNAEGTSVSIVL